MPVKLILCLFSALFTAQSFAEPVINFTSLNKHTALIELYTSQGCSSCPPAERWINKFADSDGLWDDFVPVAFHVDYWDYLGWQDPFSNAENSQRQRNYHRQGKVRSVYTPGFIVNGKEWRGRYRNGEFPMLENTPGLLNATLTGKKLHVSYSENKHLELNISILGMGLVTDIKSGENSDKKLTEHFVSLAHKKYMSKDGQWDIKLPTVNIEAEKQAIAIWISKPGSNTPLQVIGGWLPMSL